MSICIHGSRFASSRTERFNDGALRSRKPHCRRMGQDVIYRGTRNDRRAARLELLSMVGLLNRGAVAVASRIVHTGRGLLGCELPAETGSGAVAG